jgi:hypothetical protein
MNPFALFLSLFFPLCGTQGAAGITPPGTVDFPRLHLQGHSEYLAGPPGYFPHADQEIPLYDTPPAALFAAFAATAQTQTRTFALDAEPDSFQAAYVTRSRFGNFPDIIEIAVIPEPNNQSGLIFYSRSLYGEGDYGKNQEHAKAWLQTLNAKVTP